MDVSKCQTVEIDVANAVVNDNNNPFTSLVVRRACWLARVAESSSACLHCLLKL